MSRMIFFLSFAFFLLASGCAPLSFFRVILQPPVPLSLLIAQMAVAMRVEGDLDEYWKTGDAPWRHDEKRGG